MLPTKINILNIYVAVLSSGIIHGSYGQYSGHSNSFEPWLPGEEIPMYCFQCTSVVDKDCAFVQPNDTSSYHYKPCLDTEKYNGSRPFCRKIVQKIKVRDNMEIVIRKCGWVRHPRLDCYTLRNEDHEETICQCFDSACNSSLSLQAHQPLTVIVVGILLYLGISRL